MARETALSCKILSQLDFVGVAIPGALRRASAVYCYGAIGRLPVLVCYSTLGTFKLNRASVRAVLAARNTSFQVASVAATVACCHKDARAADFLPEDGPETVFDSAA